MSSNSYFDVHAQEYDSVFSNSLIGMAQRKIVQNYLGNFLVENDIQTVLELGCGTGEDALFFQSYGIEISISDPSLEMLNIAKSKLKTNVRSLNLGAIETLKLSNKKYDLIFSNFGALNCIDQNGLEQLSHLAKDKLSTRGKLIVVFISGFCLWETIYLLLKIKPTKAFRRFSKKEFSIHENDQSTSFWYYSIEQIKSIFNGYELASLKPVGSFIPPGYLSPFFERNRNLFDILETLDYASQSNMMARISDHTYFEFAKK